MFLLGYSPISHLAKVGGKQQVVAATCLRIGRWRDAPGPAEGLECPNTPNDLRGVSKAPVLLNTQEGDNRGR